VDAAQAETATLQEAYDDMATRYTVLKNRETKRKAIVKCEIGTQADLLAVDPPAVAQPAAKESEALGASLATLEGLTAKTAQAAETAAAAASPAPRKAAAKAKRASSLTVLRPSSPIWWAAVSPLRNPHQLLVIAQLFSDRPLALTGRDLRALTAGSPVFVRLV
jgi:hypothetical protein